MWARRGELGYHGPGRTSGGYPCSGLITKLRHPPARIPANDIHGLCLSCHGVAGIPPVDPRVIVHESMHSDSRPAQTTAWDRTQSTIYGIEWGTTVGAATVFRWRWNVILCIYELLYLGQEIQGWCPKWAPSTGDLYDTDMGAMKAEG